ncbi:MAG TPA: hypothetical protein PLU30_03470 [Verrucomicrobiae bacterium]|nr:hypothetical protein [Verrucomicrobiae bacterium]
MNESTQTGEDPAECDQESLHRFRAADAYMELGMADEALNELTAVRSDSPGRPHAEFRVMCLEVALGRYREAIERGRGLERSGCQSDLLHDWIGLAHHLAGQNREAMQAWQPLLPEMWDDDNRSYGMACAMAEVGDFASAVRWLVQCFSLSTKFHDKAFFDVEIEPLLKHGAEGPVGIWALPFAHPAFQRALERARTSKGEIRADPRLRDVAPVHVRPWLETDLVTTTVQLHPRTPPDLRHAYLEWQDCRLAANASRGEMAARRATQWILDHQLAWAEAHARRGNPLGARYHALFAIAHRPADYDRASERLRPLGMGYLFDDLQDLSRDEAIHLAVLWLGSIWRTVRLREELQDLGTAAKRTGLALFLKGGLLRNEGDLSAAASAYHQATARWPQDPSPWINRIAILTEMGRRDEAATLFQSAPACCAVLRVWETFAARLRNRGACITDPTYDSFYGQPDLGGILVPPWHIESPDPPCA